LKKASVGWPFLPRKAFNYSVQIMLVDLEVYYIDDLEIHTVDQHHVAADKHVPAIGRRRRQTAFEILRNVMHFRSQTRR